MNFILKVAVGGFAAFLCIVAIYECINNKAEWIYWIPVACTYPIAIYFLIPRKYQNMVNEIFLGIIDFMAQILN